MPTLAELTQDTIRQLYGYSQIVPQRMSLKQKLSATDREVFLSGVPGVSRSVIEVDDELVYITEYDSTRGAGLIEPWGRGFDGTTAVDHAEGAMVTMDPQWTTKAVREELLNQIRAIYPDLWAVRAFSHTASTGVAIPTAGRVTDVFTDNPDELPTRVERFDQSEGALYVWGIADATPLRIYAATRPDVPQPNEDVCLSSGLPLGSEVVIQLGAIAKFVGGISLALTQSNDVEQTDRQTVVGLSGTTALQRLLFQQRMAEIQRLRDALFEERPLRPNRI